MCIIPRAQNTIPVPAPLTFRPLEGQFALTDRPGTQNERLSHVAALVWTYCDGRHDRR